MATVLKLGSLLLDGEHTKPGARYKLGQSIDFGEGDDLQWVVVNGLMIADRPLLIDISWGDLDRQDLVFGKRVTINGQKFLCRLLKVGTEKETPNEWDAALDVTGEKNALWHWMDSSSWGQESAFSSYRVRRGGGAPRHRDYSWFDLRYDYLDFRPALELLASDSLVPGNRVCAIGGQSILYGELMEATDCDAVIQSEIKSVLSEADNRKFYTKLEESLFAVDRTKMVIQAVGGDKRGLG